MTHPTPHKILILGGGYAGLMAASRASHAGPAVQVTLIDARPSFTQRIRLHETLAGRKPKTLDYASLLGRRGARFVQARVESLDPGRRRVLARSFDGARIELDYDTLVLALGSATRASVPGVAEHAVRLDDPAALREAAARIAALAGAGGRVLVAGGGLTGIEAASELAERHPGLRVTLATRGRVGDGYSADGGAHLRRRLTGLGVEILDDASVGASKRTGRRSPAAAASPSTSASGPAASRLRPSRGRRGSPWTPLAAPSWTRRSARSATRRSWWPGTPPWPPCPTAAPSGWAA